MSKNKLRFLAMMMAGQLFGVFAHAQESANSSGGNASGSGGTVAFSIGQIAYTTNSGSSGSVAQGVQHAYDIIPVGITENENNNSLTVFPNPTTDILILQAPNFELFSFNYQLTDLHGKLLSNGKITSFQTQINTSGLPCATYFINVVNPSNEKIQSFKIIKN